MKGVKYMTKKKVISGLEVYLDEELGTYVLEFNDVQGRTGRYIISDDFAPKLLHIEGEVYSIDDQAIWSEAKEI